MSATDLPASVFRPDGSIDVRKLIDVFDEAEHARRADQYFADRDLTQPDFFKPLGHIAHAEQMLYKLRAALQLLEPFPSAEVLDFGTGLGWLSRVLARLGMRVYACDIAASALRLSEAFTLKREPELADRISYHMLDGPKIPLPDNSIDRIFSYDALHHVPRYEPVLREMARVLRPGGLAVFVEPSDLHSQSQASQAEMRSFGVIENDVDIFALAEMGAAHGFIPGEVAVTLSKVPTLDFNTFRAEVARTRSGQMPDQPVIRQVFAAVDPNISNLRVFSLRYGEAPKDSRAIPHGETGVGTIAITALRRAPEGVVAELRVTNTGPYRWIASGTAPGSVNIGAMLRTADGSINRNWRRMPVPVEALSPGGSATCRLVLPDSPQTAGIAFDLVAEHICWFGADVEQGLS
ncbi:methyltransferase family protein [Humitalea rosea]|uniref:Methyltransferase family protein n=1 Tax=Humitalea rosea TaxID=990373 RepID=A0A2W7IG30_9PROT|nr:class I SAM-dependent methyltransferase [Humitalea rosea]PZW37723.1 methyltransferase family protein [Humitalea rosea]